MENEILRIIADSLESVCRMARPESVHSIGRITSFSLIYEATTFAGYRQESCALFRQPHKPAVRCGYPSSRVTSR